MLSEHKLNISHVELLALKKLALINNALADSLSGQARVEQRALTSVLVDVLNRADYKAGKRALDEAGK